ncbi:hypothetical protein LI328DRAFT_87091 [Trichoderma asperelloides]|nr:hypothetical protein LI328DRAFT_87091 [Trichoderma asperelloides]
MRCCAKYGGKYGVHALFTVFVLLPCHCNAILLLALLASRSGRRCDPIPHVIFQLCFFLSCWFLPRPLRFCLQSSHPLANRQLHRAVRRWVFWGLCMAAKKKLSRQSSPQGDSPPQSSIRHLGSTLSSD